MENIYDNEGFFQDYAQMSRSRQGLAGAGEWRQLEKLFPDLRGAAVLAMAGTVSTRRTTARRRCWASTPAGG